MTFDQLQDILTSKPRRRVAQISLLWLVAAFLTPVRLALRIPALPFLWVSEARFRASRRVLVLCGDIRDEAETKRLREKYTPETEWENQ